MTIPLYYRFWEILPNQFDSSEQNKARHAKNWFLTELQFYELQGYEPTKVKGDYNEYLKRNQSAFNNYWERIVQNNNSGQAHIARATTSRESLEHDRKAIESNERFIEWM